jgi:hypothetical protein
MSEANASLAALAWACAHWLLTIVRSSIMYMHETGGHNFFVAGFVYMHVTGRRLEGEFPCARP